MNNQDKLLIEMVMRQTSYTFDEAKIELEKNNNNYIKVIKNCLGIVKSERDIPTTSINQQIYGEIRKFMDVSSKNFLDNKEREKKQNDIKKYIANQKLKHEEKQLTEKTKNLQNIEE